MLHDPVLHGTFADPHIADFDPKQWAFLVFERNKTALLYDPARMIDWWDGIERIESHGTDGKGNVTIWPQGYPDFPMPQNLRTDADGHRVTISCLVSDLEFRWQLEPTDHRRNMAGFAH